MRRRAALLLVAGAEALAVVWVEALGSHAAALDSQRTVAITAAAVHILAACLWLGMMPALVLMLWPHPGGGAGGTALVRACAGPLTGLLAVSAGTVLVTGLYGAGRQVQYPGDLLATGYGRTLLAKGVLVATLLGVAAVNAVRLHGARTVTRRVVAIEAGVGLFLLLAAGTLAETAPATGQQLGYPAGQATMRDATAADLVVTISATPNRPGLNAFTVTAASTRRPPSAVVDGVRLVMIGSRSRSSALDLQQVGPERFFGAAELSDPAPTGWSQCCSVPARR
jgi:copper transport protein